MDNTNILLQRHSVRDFTDKEIDVDLLKQIILEAQKAPSYENSQPWKVYIATGKTLESIREVHKQKIENREKSWTEVAPPHGWQVHPQKNVENYRKEMERLIGENGVKDLLSQNAVLFNAPAIIYLTIPIDSSHYTAYDVGAFGYGILLSAYHHGLGTVSAYQSISYPGLIRDHFDIPEEESIMMGIAIGYPKEDRPLSTLIMSRDNLENIIQIKE